MGRVFTPRRRSYSQLSSFTECSQRYYLERVVDVPRPQAVWFPAGKAYHSTTEWFDREMFAGHPILLEAGRQKLAQVWADEFDREMDATRQIEPDVSKWFTAGRPTREKPNGEDAEWWSTAGAAMCQDYASWWERNDQYKVWTLPDGEPALEVPVQRALNGVPVLGYVDQVLESNDGRLLVVDKKTGSRVPQHPLQLATYAVELEEQFARQFSFGAYFMARPAELTPPKWLGFMGKDLLGQMYSRMDEAERRGLYLPNLGQHCTRCLVKDWCQAAGGTKQIPEAV